MVLARVRIAIQVLENYHRVGLRMVADDLAGKHEGGNKEPVARRALGGGERALRRCSRNNDAYVTLSDSRVRCKSYAMKWSSGAWGLLSGSWCRLVGAREEVRDEPGGQTRYPLTAVKGSLASLLAMRKKFTYFSLSS